jgi:large subunit ribosomal protein L23
MSTAKPAEKATKATKAAKPSPKAAAAPTTDAAKPAKARAAKTQPKQAAAKTPAGPRHDPSRLAQVLVEPIVSEKATMVSEKRNQVVFKVLRDSTKPEIKAAVELMFPKTEVASVTTTVQKGKTKRFGRSTGRRDHVKKAYVTLKPGHELNFSGEGA